MLAWSRDQQQPPRRRETVSSASNRGLTAATTATASAAAKCVAPQNHRQHSLSDAVGFAVSQTLRFNAVKHVLRTSGVNGPNAFTGSSNSVPWVNQGVESRDTVATIELRSLASCDADPTTTTVSISAEPELTGHPQRSFPTACIVSVSTNAPHQSDLADQDIVIKDWRLSDNARDVASPAFTTEISAKTLLNIVAVLRGDHPPAHVADRVFLTLRFVGCSDMSDCHRIRAVRVEYVCTMAPCLPNQQQQRVPREAFATLLENVVPGVSTPPPQAASGGGRRLNDSVDLEVRMDLSPLPHAAGATQRTNDSGASSGLHSTHAADSLISLSPPTVGRWGAASQHAVCDLSTLQHTDEPSVPAAAMAPASSTLAWQCTTPKQRPTRERARVRQIDASEADPTVVEIFASPCASASHPTSDAEAAEGVAPDHKKWMPNAEVEPDILVLAVSPVVGAASAASRREAPTARHPPLIPVGDDDEPHMIVVEEEYPAHSDFAEYGEFSDHHDHFNSASGNVESTPSALMSTRGKATAASVEREEDVWYALSPPPPAPSSAPPPHRLEAATAPRFKLQECASAIAPAHQQTDCQPARTIQSTQQQSSFSSSGNDTDGSCVVVHDLAAGRYKEHPWRAAPVLSTAASSSRDASCEIQALPAVTTQGLPELAQPMRMGPEFAEFTSVRPRQSKSVASSQDAAEPRTVHKYDEPTAPFVADLSMPQFTSAAFVQTTSATAIRLTPSGSLYLPQRSTFTPVASFRAVQAAGQHWRTNSLDEDGAADLSPALQSLFLNPKRSAPILTEKDLTEAKLAATSMEKVPNYHQEGDLFAMVEATLGLEPQAISRSSSRRVSRSSSQVSSRSSSPAVGGGVTAAATERRGATAHDKPEPHLVFFAGGRASVGMMPVEGRSEASRSTMDEVRRVLADPSATALEAVQRHSQGPQPTPYPTSIEVKRFRAYDEDDVSDDVAPQQQHQLQRPQCMNVSATRFCHPQEFLPSTSASLRNASDAQVVHGAGLPPRFVPKVAASSSDEENNRSDADVEPSSSKRNVAAAPPSSRLPVAGAVQQPLISSTCWRRPAEQISSEREDRPPHVPLSVTTDGARANDTNYAEVIMWCSKHHSSRVGTGRRLIVLKVTEACGTGGKQGGILLTMKKPDGSSWKGPAAPIESPQPILMMEGGGTTTNGGLSNTVWLEGGAEGQVQVLLGMEAYNTAHIHRTKVKSPLLCVVILRKGRVVTALELDTDTDMHRLVTCIRQIQ